MTGKSSFASGLAAQQWRQEAVPRTFARQLGTAEPAPAVTSAASSGPEAPDSAGGRKVVSRRSASGVHYQGEVNAEMQADGEGVLIQPDGAYHEGHWRNGAPHGWGRSVGADKWTEDEGEWLAGELHGRASQRLRLDATRTATFEGEFEHGVRKRGTLRVSDGKVYAGEWTPGGALRRGKYVARHEGDHRSVMVGEWHDGGIFAGRITLFRSRAPGNLSATTLAASAPEREVEEAPNKEGAPEHRTDERGEHEDETVKAKQTEEKEAEEPTEGEVVAEESEGRFERGVLRRGRRTVSGSGGGGAEGGEVVYEGEFDEQGILVNGSRSQTAGSASFLEEGTFRNGFLVKGKQTVAGYGEAEGQWNPETEVFVGKASSATGTVEEGEFVQGKLVKGKRTLADGRAFEGEWEGIGVARFKGRAWVGQVEMEGQFEGDRLDGKGRVIDRATGREVEGQWKQGDLVQGRIRHPDGLVEEGEFLRGKMVRGRIHRPTT